MDLNSALSQLAASHRRGEFQPEGGALAVMNRLLAHRAGTPQSAPLGPVAAMGLTELEVAVLLQEAVAMSSLSMDDFDAATRARFFG